MLHFSIVGDLDYEPLFVGRARFTVYRAALFPLPCWLTDWCILRHRVSRASPERVGSSVSTLFLPEGTPCNVRHPFLLGGSCCPWPSVPPTLPPRLNLGPLPNHPTHPSILPYSCLGPTRQMGRASVRFFLRPLSLSSVPLLSIPCSIGSQVGLVCVGQSVGRSRYIHH